MDYKKRNLILSIGFILTLIVSYQFAIKKTIEIKRSLNYQDTELSLLKNAKERIYYLENQNYVLDSLLNSKQVSADSSYEQVLLNVVTRLAGQLSLKIVAFEEPHIFIQDKFETKTFTIKVKGSFKKLVDFHRMLEKNKLGLIQNVQFIKKRNYRLKRNEISCVLRIQKIER